jgi:hypothetical protein
MLRWSSICFPHPFGVSLVASGDILHQSILPFWTQRMALISRRQMIRSLRKVATLVSDIKLKDWASRLDKVRDDYVATEWEIILLESFSKHGEVRYEPSSDERIDIVFSGSNVYFAADITTASDRFLHQTNPVHQFSEELGRQARKNKILSFGGFSYEIWHDQEYLSEIVIELLCSRM